MVYTVLGEVGRAAGLELRSSCEEKEAIFYIFCEISIYRVGNIKKIIYFSNIQRRWWYGKE